MLKKLAGDLTDEAKRPGLELEDERSIQHLERLVSEIVDSSTRAKSDKVKEAFDKIESVQ